MVRWMWVVIDRPAGKGAEAATFWATVTGTGARVSPGGDELATLLPLDGDAHIRLREVDGPAGVSLGLEVDDIAWAGVRARDLGAVPVAERDEIAMLRSPGGLEFSLTPWGGAKVRPGPMTGPVGVTSRLDQVCIDAAMADLEGEVEFWAALTGWPWRPADRPEFTLIAGPSEMPFRFLAQRLGEERPVSAHLDMACSDVDAAAGWHQTLGARVIDRRRDWTVMTDPAGGVYCLTNRNPA